jgi:glycosyltransferase 2 family protein
LGYRRYLKPLVSLALYAFIFTYWVDVADLAARLRATRVHYVLLAVVAYGAGQVISAYKWYRLLEPLRLTVSLARVVSMYFIGMFFNIFLPTIVGGDAVKALLLSRETGATGRAAVSVFMERNTGLFALLAIASVAAWYAPPVRLFSLSLPLLVLLLVAGYIVANIVLASAHAYRLVDAIVALTPLAGIRHRASSLYEGLLPYRTRVGLLAAAVGLSFLFQTIVIGVVFLNARALDQSFPVSALAVFVPIISLAGMLPVTVNGLGVREALYVLLFGQLGASRDLSVSLAVLYLVVTFMASLPGGIVYALQQAPARTKEFP